MKTNMFRLLSAAGVAASAIALASPALAHDGYYGHERHFYHHGHRVVIVQPPVFVPRPVVVYPGLVYPAPAPVYYAPPPAYSYYEPNPVGTIGGAIAGAAIGGIASHGRPGGIVAGSVIGAVVGSTLPR